MFILIPDGPFRKPGQKIQLSAIRDIFRQNHFRAASFAYFGHMWELYAFWAFVPFMLQLYNTLHPDVSLNIALWSFVVIAIGGLACVVGGYLAQTFGDKRIASIALALSGTCCLLAPAIFSLESPVIVIAFLLFWGMVVIADSPLFSTLVAHNAPAELKGTALTIVNSIGFFITIISIQLINELTLRIDSAMALTVLAAGPILGLTALRGKKEKTLEKS